MLGNLFHFQLKKDNQDLKGEGGGGGGGAKLSKADKKKAEKERKEREKEEKNKVSFRTSKAILGPGALPYEINVPRLHHDLRCVNCTSHSFILRDTLLHILSLSIH